MAVTVVLSAVFAFAHFAVAASTEEASLNTCQAQVKKTAESYAGAAVNHLTLRPSTFDRYLLGLGLVGQPVSLNSGNERSLQIRSTPDGGNTVRLRDAMTQAEFGDWGCIAPRKGCTPSCRCQSARRMRRLAARRFLRE